ncbi:hypothetical protein BJX61DRAFT_550061 [Aspergillus egyptiacus]|nr:hypothetical protein BJX61DRAFT_550061 [Aspergillus egyptiacus]
MVTRGLWNLHVDGRWYRAFHPPRGQSSAPDTPSTLETLRRILSHSDKFKWEMVPFPIPLHIQLDYVYTIDRDAGHLTVVKWDVLDGAIVRRTQRANLTNMQNTSLRSVDSLLEDVAGAPELTPDASFGGDVLVDQWLQPSGIHVPLNELQFQLFTHFVFTWRFYFDDMSAWEFPSLLFATLAIGLLRIAAWDFEAVYDTDTLEIPITFSSVPRWTVPCGDVFWFHGYLIVYCSSQGITTSAVSRAQDYLTSNNHGTATVRGIAISIQHIAFFGISNGSRSCSSPIPLVTNTSTLSCSPGFKVLTYMFTSAHPRAALAPREHWAMDLPVEILDMILRALPPLDLVAFAQASMLVEKWYYSCTSQIRGLMRSFDLSIPCCGRRNSSEAAGAHCSICYAWYHEKCTELTLNAPGDNEIRICPACRENRPCASLNMGGIYRTYRTKKVLHEGKVLVDGQPRMLRLRTSKPSARRPELWLIRTRGPPPPRQINFLIHFGGAFSGLAYGYDEN